MKLKSCPALVKATGDPASGEFEAIVSVFNNVDHQGDAVLPGAFTDTIAEWASGPDTLPVLWSHRMDDPMFNIGAVKEAAELAPNDPRLDAPGASEHLKANGGLWVKGVIDTGPDASPIAVQALKLLRARRVTQFSYAYDEIDSGPVIVDGQDAWGLKRLALYEVSPTQVGANELTELLVAKSGDINVRNALAALGRALAGIDGNAADSGSAKAEEPHGVNAEEPARVHVSQVRLLHDLSAFELQVTD